jgi:hypothetical protein
MREPAFGIPDDAEIERERTRRRKNAAPAPPLNPPPATIGELLAECTVHRRRIMAAMREGHRIYPLADFIAFLTGNETGFCLPPIGRLFDGAVLLDLGDAPPFNGEPQTGRDAVAGLNTLIAWCKEKMEPAPIKGERIKEPSKDALKCYRLSIAIGRTQSELAEILSRELSKPVDQPKVSKWLTEVKAWLKAGNILPDLSEPDEPRLKRKRSVDPRLIDNRIVGRPKTTRQSSRDDELERLIAEQQADDNGPEPIDDDD